MALKVRLSRKGGKKNPFYRLVVQDRESARDGRFVEILGTYDPLREEEKGKLTLNRDRYNYWYAKGARPTKTVDELIKRSAA